MVQTPAGTITKDYRGKEMQIQTSSALLLGQRRFSMHFIFVLVMQFNAFLMTLRRKKLVPYSAAVAWRAPPICSTPATVPRAARRPPTRRQTAADDRQTAAQQHVEPPWRAAAT